MYEYIKNKNNISTDDNDGVIDFLKGKFLEIINYYTHDANQLLRDNFYFHSADKGNRKAIKSLINLYQDDKNFKSITKYLKKSIIRQKFNKTIYIYYLAKIYNCTNKIKKMKLYLKQGIKFDDCKSMNLMANYYCSKGMKKKTEHYLLMAVNHGDPKSIFHMAILCTDKRNFKQSNKYYLMIINNTKYKLDALQYIGYNYYQLKKFDKMIKYYELAINSGSISSMIDLANYYGEINDHDKMIKYLKSAADHEDNEAMCMLGNYYFKIGAHKKMIKYYIIAIKAGNKNAIGIVKYIVSNIDKYSDIIHIIKNNTNVLPSHIIEMLHKYYI